jgi:outer membrane protein, multidrug efflux system
MRRPLCPAALALALAASHAWGQAERAPSTAPPAPDDPMLAPLLAPTHVVTTWQQALAMLTARSTDLRVAADEIARAEAGWRTALAGSLPTLTGNANVTGVLLRAKLSCGPGCTYTVPSDVITYGAGLELVQPLFAPRAWHAMGTADLVVSTARLSAEEQKRLLAAALANAIVAVVTAERVCELNRIGLRAALERLTLAKRRAALGAANALDVVRADQDVATARGAVVSGDESLRQAREALGLTLGSIEPFGVAPGIDLNGLESSARASCGPVADIDERTDIAKARSSAAVARRNVDDVWLQFSPTVNLVSDYNVSSVEQYNTLHHTWSIAAVLTVPLFEGGARYGARRDTTAQHDEALQKLDSARRSATVQVVQAKRAVEVADQSRQVTEQARNLARETERLARIAFQAGTGTSLDLIESGRRLREAEVQLALAEFNVVEARVAAVLALSRCRW